ncbi:MAG: class I SAM-dependent methyltransferase [Acidobacteria bacterium]|nr:class I SAM-dependent methyltransferase [Acidobacteriota bacterium]
MSLADHVLGDMGNVCQGRDPKQMKVLEIGCGAGLVTRALAEVFGEVHGVDISAEMVARAKAALSSFPGAHVHHINGMDLRPLGDLRFDFAYSTAVFHHIASREIIEGYLREVNRHLKPGCLFKFEVQGVPVPDGVEDDTWLCAYFKSRQMVEMAVSCRFDPRFRHGEGEECFGWWLFKWQ